MRKFLLSFIFCLMAFVGVQAEEVTGNAAQNFGTATTNISEFVVEPVTLAFAKASGSTNPAYNKSGDCRIYAKNTITATCTAGNLTKLVFTISSQGQKRLPDVTASTGTVTIDTENRSTVVWEGNAAEVVLTVGEKAVHGTSSSEAGQLCFTDFTATYSTGGDVVLTPSIATPVASVDKGVYTEAQNVTFEAEYANAENPSIKYYYTVDGTEPTATSDELTAALVVEETCTVKVIAVMTVGEDTYTSRVATYEYIISEPVTYVAATSLTQVVAGKVLIVAGTKAPVALTGNYGYLQVRDVVVAEAGIEDAAYYAFELEEAEGGWYIKDNAGKYLYQKGTYDSFNVSATVPTEGGVWTIEIENGDAKIINAAVNKFVQYDTQYSSYGSYAEKKDTGVMPKLYVPYVEAEEGEDEGDENQLIDLTKVYRIKRVDATGTVKYLNVPNDNTVPVATATNGTVTATAENVTSGEQIFKFEKGENGNYYLKNANGYYLVCAASAVYASQTEKTNLTIEAVATGDSYYLRDADYASHQLGTIDITNSDPSNYLKEVSGYVYSNGNSARKDSYTWIIEEYVAPETPEGGEGDGEEGDETPDAILQSVVFDFSSNAWGIPTMAETPNFSGVKTKENYTNDGVTITIDPTANSGAFYYESGYVRLGKTGTKLILPAFDFPVEKIEVIGHSAASSYANSEMNVYVGGTAVSTTTKGSTATNTYEIAAESQAVGNVYELVVGSNSGSNSAYIFISAIKVYPKGEKLEAPVLSVAAGEYTEPITVTVSSNAEALGATDIVYYYTTNGLTPTVEDDEFPATGLVISENTTLKVVVACKYNGVEYISDVTTAEYKFRELSATLNVVKVTPNTSVEKIEKITIEFEDEVVLGAMVQLTLKKGEETRAQLDNRHASVNGKVVTVSLGTDMQTEVGEYTLVVKAGSIKRASDGVEYTGELKFTVTNPLTIAKVTPAENETVEKLESITIEFSDDIVSKFEMTDRIKLYGANNPQVIYITQISVKGKILTLTLNMTDIITKGDVYTLVLPAGKIASSGGVEFEGKELKFTVVEPFTAKVTPAEPVEVLDVITIEFSHDIESKFDATAFVKLWADKDAMNPIVINEIVAEGKVLTLTLTEPITTPDTYRLNFPAGKIVRASDKAEFAGGQFVFEVKEVGDETAIDAAAADAEAVIYDLSGRRVKEITVKGIYIVNGKKVIK
ncbi:MAG: chitobiase/beta-hexosaminidase C-terminal domain-containing protein [Bacteroidaceae bacterium]|nr:chitobiase/beta-hexosaminidase C-terminal domain-containing protein [Bacteroidaceae bacterium]